VECLGVNATQHTTKSLSNPSGTAATRGSLPNNYLMQD